MTRPDLQHYLYNYIYKNKIKTIHNINFSKLTRKKI